MSVSLLDEPRTDSAQQSSAASDRLQGTQQISERRLLQSLKLPLKRIWLPEAGKLHTFRQSFISKALAEGIATANVRTYVGHASDGSQALDTHMLDDQLQRAMQRFVAATPEIESLTNLSQSVKARNHAATKHNGARCYIDTLP